MTNAVRTGMATEHDEVVPCGRMHDHEGHRWFSDDGKWCRGVVARPLRGPSTAQAEVEEEEEKIVVRCRCTHNDLRCTRPDGHEETLHVSELGNTWPAHVPAPGGVFSSDETKVALAQSLRDAADFLRARADEIEAGQ